MSKKDMKKSSYGQNPVDEFLESAKYATTNAEYAGVAGAAMSASRRPATTSLVPKLLKKSHRMMTDLDEMTDAELELLSSSAERRVNTQLHGRDDLMNSMYQMIARQNEMLSTLMHMLSKMAMPVYVVQPNSDINPSRTILPVDTQDTNGYQESAACDAETTHGE